jgi:chaperonin GroES
MPLVPLFAKIIVQRKEEEVTSSGIILPPTAQDGSLKATEGLVIAVGATAQGVQVGDKILFGKYSGSDFQHDREKFIIMNDTDVLCRIEEK